MKWTDEQIAVFDFMWRKNQNPGHLCVEALAGTGKTSTVVKGAGWAPEREILFSAHNKSIQRELSTKMGRGMQASTLHALGNRLCSRAGIRTLDGKRGRKIAEQIVTANFPIRQSRKAANLVAKVAAKGKHVTPLASRAEELSPLLRRFRLFPDRAMRNAGLDENELVRCAFLAMARARCPDGTLDFDDMVYLPVTNGYGYPMVDMVVVDECQDMTDAAIRLAWSVTDGRICVVGDRNQAIYGFMGADTGSMDRLAKAYDAKRLSLTSSFRCGRAIVEHAQLVVPEFSCPNEAHDGSVSVVTEDDLALAKVGDFLLSRTNAPLITRALRFAKMNKKCQIVGKDISSDIATLLRNLGLKGGDSPGKVIAAMDGWLKEREKAINDAKDADVEEWRDAVMDRYEVVVMLAEESDDVDDLLRLCRSMFAETEAADSINLSTIHKAKGREAGRVWVLYDTFRELNSAESRMLYYVAVTRAKHELMMVGGMMAEGDAR